jgi:phytoene dehydrogenase-like protein
VRACVVGSGPNGLSAAITLAQAGVSVQVYEAQEVPGGGARTLPLTLPGFLHDFGSAVHPLGAGSPFFQSLSLERHGLEWIHSPSFLAHPFDDGTAVLLRRDLRDAEDELGADANSWRALLAPLVENWAVFTDEVLRPLRLPRRCPLLMARFGLHAIWPAATLARHAFSQPRTRALFAGLAAHSNLSLQQPLTSGFALLLAAAGHAVGWPIPRRGAQSITGALLAVLRELGGAVHTSWRVSRLAELPAHDFALCDVTPRQLLGMAAERFSPGFRLRLSDVRYGPGVFKMDFALREPVPWRASACRQAATLHLGGSLEEMVASEEEVRAGRPPRRPFMIVAQPSLFDTTRAPEGKHTLWAYCHVPHGSTFDMQERMEEQLERFAPGFRECVLARRVFTPDTLEQWNENLVGGDMSGGEPNLAQFVFRPTARLYGTSARNVFVCSSSTPPGPGVHGMCGYHAARFALRRMAR